MVQPSSTTIATFPSGDTPTQVMFFVVEMGSVSDVLLRMEEKTPANFCHSQTWRKTESITQNRRIPKNSLLMKLNDGLSSSERLFTSSGRTLRFGFPPD